ncbi:hypothetical protein FPZ42_01075 [Mucilaginibacter achroorhodeus]|uniref:Uncharacterized protein n=1 Tax=Mucilaginibacter achroorhodeus TaxID=2599294 RepID=A0A563U920_9SPHI|nr:hypothetical protein [Mucilaginibacter achroorhodeus]TWR27834.1 hypothetical protein FPZ42_01075 [Mucilaginibacter achroorhodeus]
MNYCYQPHAFNALEYAILLMQAPGADDDGDGSDNLADELNLNTPDESLPKEGSWDDEEDEDFEDQTEWRNDLKEIRVGDDVNEPDPEDADHLPDDDLQ